MNHQVVVNQPIEQWGPLLYRGDYAFDHSPFRINPVFKNFLRAAAYPGITCLLINFWGILVGNYPLNLPCFYSILAMTLWRNVVCWDSRSVWLQGGFIGFIARGQLLISRFSADLPVFGPIKSPIDSTSLTKIPICDASKTCEIRWEIPMLHVFNKLKRTVWNHVKSHKVVPPPVMYVGL